MKLGLRITKEAREDLKDIWRYISAESVNAADDFIEVLHQKCTELARKGYYGRRRPDLGESIHSYPFRKYMIYFQKKRKYLYVVRILRGSRDQSKALEE